MRKIALSLFCLFFFISCTGANQDSSTKDYLKQYKDQQGPLIVDYHSPTNDVTIDQNKVVIHFSQPMVPLTSLGKAESTGLVTISPKLEGYFKWVNSRTLVYQAKGELPYATTFNVIVSAGKESLLGYAMLKDFSFSFKTPEPRVFQVLPNGESNEISQNPIFRVSFNQAVKAKQLYEKLELTQGEPSQKVKIKTECYYHEELQKTGSGKGCTQVNISPLSKLNKITKVTLKVLKGLEGIQGSDLSKEDYAISYKTHGDFEVTDIKCAKDCLPYSTLHIHATTPIDRTNFHKYVFFDPPVPNVERMYKYWDKINKYLAVSLNFKPSTNYTVTVNPEIKDIYGQETGTKKQFKFQTAPHEPTIFTPYITDQVMSYHSGANLGFLARNVKTATARFKYFNRDSDIISFLEDPNESFDSLVGNAQSWDLTMEFLGKITNKKKYFSIPASKVLGNRKSSVVLSEFYSPDYVHYNHSTKSYEVIHDWVLRQITDLAIDFKLSKTDGLVWVTSLSSAKNLANVRVMIYNPWGKLIYRTLTNSKGFAKIPGRDELHRISRRLVPKDEKKRATDPLYIFAHYGTDRAFVTDYWNDDMGYGYYGYDDYSDSDDDSDSSNQKPKETVKVRGHVLTDRGLYKPGEELKIKGYLRQITATGLKPFLDPVTVVIKEPRQSKPIKIDVTPNSRGNFSVSHTLSEYGQLGHYSIKILPQVEGADINSYAGFRVEKFRKPEFKVTFDKANKEFFKGDQIKFDIRANYLFGAPMKKAPISTYVASFLTSYYPKNDLELRFGRLYEHRKEHQQQIYKLGKSIEAKLDDKGLYAIQYETQKLYKDFIDPIRIRFEAEVKDVSKQSQASTKRILMHPASYYVGGKVNQLFYDENEKIQLEFATLSPEGKILIDKEVAVDLMRVKWISVKRETLHSQYETETKRIEERLDGCIKKTQKENNACDFAAKESGYYFFKLSSKDSQGRLSISEIPFYVTGSNYSYWPSEDGFNIEMVTNKKMYGVGDVAEVLIKSPYAKAHALVSIERDHIVSYEVKNLEGSSPIINIPIKESYAPNVFVKVILIKGSSEIDPSHLSKEEGKKKRLALPLVKTGRVEIKVKPHGKKLKLVVESEKKIYKPGDEVKLNFKVNGFAKEKTAEITVMAVDEGVVLAGGYVLQDPLWTLFAPYYHAVMQIDSRSRFVGTQGLDDKLDDPASGGGRMKGFRKNFIPLAYFNGSIETDDNGVASVSFKLPDQLTTFKVMAIANANSDQFGLADTSFQTQKDIMIRPALPRFLRVGDRFESDVVVHNQTDKELQVTMAAQSDLLKVSKGETGNLVIPAKTSVSHTVEFMADEVSFTEKAGELFGEDSVLDKSIIANVRISAKTDSVEDKVAIELPVYLERLEETVSTSGASAGTVTEFFEKSEGIVENYGGLDISLSANLLSRVKDKIQILKEYPYDCLEQRLSKIYPLVLFPKVDQFFAGNERNPSVRIDRLKRFMKRLKSEQAYNGGFSFWPGRKESPALTLMVAEFLIHAQRAGLDVDDILRKIVNRITDVYSKGTSYAMRGYSESYKKKLMVHALYVIFKLGEAQPSYYPALRQVFSDLDLVSQQRLLEMFASENPKDLLIDDWLGQINNKIRLKGRLAYVETGSLSGDYYFGYSNRVMTAQVLQTLLKIKPSHPMVFPLLLGMMDEKKNQAYSVSYESLAVLKALKTYQAAMPMQTTAVNARLVMNDKDLIFKILDVKKTEERIELPLDKLPSKMNLKLIKDTGDVFFYDMKYSYALKKFREFGLEEGITVQREYQDLQGNPVDPKKLEHGKTYKVVLNFFFADQTDYLVVEEPLAAGNEPVNFALKTVRQSLRQYDTGKNPTLKWYLEHKEFHDKKIILFADRIPRGFFDFTYFINVTNRGTYLTPPAKAMEMYDPDVFGTTGKEDVVVN